MEKAERRKPNRSLCCKSCNLQQHRHRMVHMLQWNVLVIGVCMYIYIYTYIYVYMYILCVMYSQSEYPDETGFLGAIRGNFWCWRLEGFPNPEESIPM